MVEINDKKFCDMYEEWKMEQIQKQQKEYYDNLENKKWNSLMNAINLKNIIDEKEDSITVKNTTTEYDGKTTPSYYIGKHKQITAAEVVADFGLSYNVGNAVVYLLRAGNKPNNPYLQDLIKAVHHLNMEVEQYRK